MQVVALWRYPVKSMQGEQLEAVDVGTQGIEGDRQWGVVDIATGLVLTGRRDPELLLAAARVEQGGSVSVTLPDGSTTADDGDLSTWLGRPVALRRVGPQQTGRFESALAEPGKEDDAGAPWFQWTGPPGSFHDITAVSMVATGSLRDWEPRRFRANVLLDAGDGDEDRLIGTEVGIGTTLLDVSLPIVRCVMVTRPQPGGIGRDVDVLRTINAERACHMGVGATVVGGGRVAVGDEVRTAV